MQIIDGKNIPYSVVRDELDRTQVELRMERARVAELCKAGERLLEVYEALMPGIKHIAVQDYALINEAPIEMRKAIRGED